MNALDWVFIVVLVLLGIRCMIKGFIAEVLSVAAVIAGFLAALFLYKSAGQVFVGWGLAAKPEILSAILGFAAVFLVAYFIVKLIERLLQEGIEVAQLGGVDRALGLLLGLAEGLIVVSFVLVTMSLLEPALKSVAGYSRLLGGSYAATLILPVIGPEVAKATQGIQIVTPELALPRLAPAIPKP